MHTCVTYLSVVNIALNKYCLSSVFSLTVELVHKAKFLVFYCNYIFSEKQDLTFWKQIHCIVKTIGKSDYDEKYR